MSIASFTSLVILLLAGCITPGPNNALLSASGMNFGYRASIPHMLGVLIGHAVMEFSVALGFGALYTQFPLFRLALQFIAIALLLWLAYKIATAPVDRLPRAEGGARPWKFWEAFLFQWINPKAWLIAIAVSGQYAGGENPLLAATLIFIATLIGGMASTQIWTGFGVAMSRILDTPKKRRIFNLALAALILLSVILLLGDNNAPL